MNSADGQKPGACGRQNNNTFCIDDDSWCSEDGWCWPRLAVPNVIGEIWQDGSENNKFSSKFIPNICKSELNPKICGSCSENCMSCSDKPDACTSCAKGLYLADHSCLACDSKCQTCEGTAKNCHECAPGYSLMSELDTCDSIYPLNIWQNSIYSLRCGHNFGTYCTREQYCSGSGWCRDGLRDGSSNNAWGYEYIPEMCSKKYENRLTEAEIQQGTT